MRSGKLRHSAKSDIEDRFELAKIATAASAPQIVEIPPKKFVAGAKGGQDNADGSFSDSELTVVSLDEDDVVTATRV